MTDPTRETLAELLLRWEEMYDRGQDVPATVLAKDHPDLVGEVERRIAVLKRSLWLDKPWDDDRPGDEGRDPSPHRPARTLAGRYRLDSLIAEGGFAQVYRAFDTELHREVAVKIPKPDRLDSTDAFLAEARRVAGLKHDNIVAVHDVGVVDGTCFIVSEFVEGGSLSERLGTGAVPARDALRWAGSIADALHEAHLHGIVHRDVKPGNILIDHHGNAKLADFGIAQAATGAGDVDPSLGTLRYMSPEQLQGGSATPRSDIYSLSLVFHEMLTGRVPYASTNPQSLRKEIIAGASLHSGALPARLRRICAKALHPDPRQRFSSAQEFSAAIRAASVNRGWLVMLAVPALLGAIWLATGERTAPAGHLEVTGIGTQRFIPAKIASSWRKPGVFAEIRGAGKIECPRLPMTAYVMEFDVESRNPKGTMIFYSGERGSGVEVAFGHTWPQDATRDEISCRLFRRQPFGINWIGDAFFPTHTIMTLRVVVADDFHSLTRNLLPALGGSGDVADCCVTIITTEGTDATIRRAACRALTEEDARDAKVEFPRRALSFDVAATKQRLAAHVGTTPNETPAAGRPYVLGADRMPMQWMDPGDYTMGSKAMRYVQTGLGNERVRITTGFWIAAYETTQSQWDELMDSNPSRFTGSPYLPVHHVSWTQACEYCRALTARERRAGRCPDGYEYRLPTEAEWEYACRAGTDREFPVPLAELVVRDGRFPHVMEVGASPANDWGLHEMQGNVPEWCLDEWRPYPATQEEATVDRFHTGDPRRSMFAVRGNGFWITEVGPTAFTRTKRADVGGGFRGFRTVLGPERTRSHPSAGG